MDSLKWYGVPLPPFPPPDNTTEGQIVQFTVPSLAYTVADFVKFAHPGLKVSQSPSYHVFCEYIDEY